MLAKPWVAPVFAHSPHVDEIVVFDANGRHKGRGRDRSVGQGSSAYRFDAAILLQNAIEAALIAFMAGIPQRIGFDTDARRLLLTDPVRCTQGRSSDPSDRLLPGNARGRRTDDPGHSVLN
jgi:heptosyltransferase-2